MTTPAAAGVVIVGGGVAGSLLALALRERGLPVTLLDAPAEAATTGAPLASATAISYGALPGWPLAPTPLARLAAGASRHWRQLQARHGDLGWRPQRLRLHAAGAAAGALSRLWPLPFAQVDTALLTTRLPACLVAAGVTLHPGAVARLVAGSGRDADSGPGTASPWWLELRDGGRLPAETLVLAAGAYCRQLWPTLPAALRGSWAAVLELADDPQGLGLAPGVWLPAAFARMALERRAADLHQPEWLVDGALVPWGAGALLGQHTLVRPAGVLGAAPVAGEVEQQLRQGLADQAWSRPLAASPGRLRQAAVAFCSEGLPLVGPVSGAPGLWLFSGFSAGFSQVPVLAPLLAAWIAGGTAASVAERQLRRLQLGPVAAAGADKGG